MAYLFLALAIAAEVTATSLLPQTMSFTVLLPSVAVVLGYLTSIALLSRVVRTVPVGIAYAIWSAVGTLTVIAIGVVYLGQQLSTVQLLGAVLVVIGVVALNLGGARG